VKNHTIPQKLKVAVGLSGGVDSSVAAVLLKEQGYEVTGVFMQCWDARADGCKADEDRVYAVKTAAKLGIKFEHLDYRDPYKAKVMEYFLREYRVGRTPNPDVTCNKEIKFGLFFDWALKKGFDYVATGHYARVYKNKSGCRLLKGTDPKKDQSYFLYLLGQKQLAKTLFPVGNLTKSEVRKVAQNKKLPAAERPESMGICFIGEVNIKDFLKKYIPIKIGKVLSVDGEVIGEHDGVWFYTVGQRHGFKLKKYFGKALYVAAKNIDENELVVGGEKDVRSVSFCVNDIHWISKDFSLPSGGLECSVRIRHLGKIYRCAVSKVTQKTGDEKLQVKLARAVFAVASGQSAVFYKGQVVLGGGIIA